MSKNLPSSNESHRKRKTLIPLVRIRKIMQENEEVGKLSSRVPVVVDKAVELFVKDLVSEVLKEFKGGKVNTDVIKEQVKDVERFRFVPMVDEEDESSIDE